MPLAGAPLRPLEYFLICQAHPFPSFTVPRQYTMPFLNVQHLIFLKFLKFQVQNFKLSKPQNIINVSMRLSHNKNRGDFSLRFSSFLLSRFQCDFHHIGKRFFTLLSRRFLMKYETVRNRQQTGGVLAQHMRIMK